MAGILADQTETALSELPPGVIAHRQAAQRAALPQVQPIPQTEPRPQPKVTRRAPVRERDRDRDPLARSWASEPGARPASNAAALPERSAKLWLVGLLFLFMALSLVVFANLALG